MLAIDLPWKIYEVLQLPPSNAVAEPVVQVQFRDIFPCPESFTWRNERSPYGQSARKSDNISKEKKGLSPWVEKISGPAEPGKEVSSMEIIMDEKSQKADNAEPWNDSVRTELAKLQGNELFWYSEALASD